MSPAAAGKLDPQTTSSHKGLVLPNARQPTAELCATVALDSQSCLESNITSQTAAQQTPHSCKASASSSNRPPSSMACSNSTSSLPASPWDSSSSRAGPSRPAASPAALMSTSSWLLGWPARARLSNTCKQQHNAQAATGTQIYVNSTSGGDAQSA